MLFYSRILCLVAFAMAVLPALAQPNPATLKSPNGELEISIATLNGTNVAESGQVAYRVSLNGKPVLEWSKLGLDIQGMPVLGTEVRIVGSDGSTHDET